MKRTRVLILDRLFESFGGTQWYLDVLVRALLRADFTVEVALNADDALAGLRKALDGYGATIFDTPISQQSDRRVAKWLFRFIREREPDILHVNCLARDMRGAITRMRNWRSLPGKRLFTMHGSLIPEQLYSTRRRADWAPFSYRWRTLRERRRFLSFFDRSISVSKQNIDVVTKTFGLAKDVFTYVPNGVDIERFRPLREARSLRNGSKVVIGSCGRLAEEKRYDLLIRAVALLAKDYPVELHFAGAGPEEQPLRRLTNSLGMKAVVKFLGYQDDVPAFLRSLDIFALTSRNEGLPYAQLEAMATGLPSVVSAVNELPVVVREGVDGFVIPPGDVDACADRLSTLLKDRELRITMGANSRRRICEDFSEEDCLAKTIAVYHGLLARNGASV